jgi:hypothetical protein
MDDTLKVELVKAKLTGQDLSELVRDWRCRSLPEELRSERRAPLVPLSIDGAIEVLKCIISDIERGCICYQPAGHFGLSKCVNCPVCKPVNRFDMDRLEFARRLVNG